MKNTIQTAISVTLLLSPAIWPGVPVLLSVAEFAAWFALLAAIIGPPCLVLLMLLDETKARKHYPNFAVLTWAGVRWFVTTGALIFAGYPKIAVVFGFASIVYVALAASLLQRKAVDHA